MRRSTPGSARTSRITSDPRSDLLAPADVRRADEDVGRAAVGSDGRERLRQRRPTPPRGSARPSTIAEPAEGGERLLLLLRELLSGPAHPEDVDLCPEPLRRAPGPPQQALGACLRRDEREDAVGQRPLASGSSTAGCRRCFDVLGDLAQRKLAQRGEVRRRRKKFEERAFDVLPGRRPSPPGGAAGAPPASGRRGRPASASSRTRSGKVSRTRTPVSSKIEVVKALEVLDVDGRDHVDAGGEHLLDVLVALGVSRARGVRVRQLVDQRELGRPPEDRVDIHLVERRGRGARRCGAARPRSPSASAAVSGRACGSR